MILPIYLNPQPILTQKTACISDEEAVSDSFHRLLDDMRETMRNADGIGLAAPQVGIGKRCTVVDLRALGHQDADTLEMINPKITHSSFRKVIIEEGCLSIPGVYGTVKRPESVTVTYLDREGVKQKLKASGLLARVIQHEVDHLDGILFTGSVITYSEDKPITPAYPHVK